ncbi:hypothetical protein O3G_MSEX011072 [Manduca sexta]|uniref:Phospholipid scramblase n=1 Tax=Manduca sexta TaxID=7130 RepID=A0A922CTF3_MANSE|nr:hypothetical protein O3G_MSEX011072 [Manduca sexta]
MTQTAPIPPQAQSFVDIIKEPVFVVPEPQVSTSTTPALLEELSSVDRLFITKRLRVKSVLFLRGKKNRFYVRTPDQNLVYSVEEDNRVLPCQLQRLEVFAPPGQRIGTIEQQWTVVKPLYLVRNEEGEVVFWIKGPYVTISCFKDVKFSICRSDGSPVGGTCKRWQGLTHALFLSPVTDRFGVAFERDLSVQEKALLLAATLLMDYMYYDA